MRNKIKLGSKSVIDYWEQRYLKGKVTNDEWSRMTPSMRLHLKRKNFSLKEE